jgi:hypothetical protein
MGKRQLGISVHAYVISFVHKEVPVDAAKINTPGKFGRISWESLETRMIVSE